MLDKINGLPAHVLLLHAVVVLVPLACLALVLHAGWPAARRRLGVVTPVLALVALVFVPLTTHAGQWLQHRLEAGGLNPSVFRHHVQIGRDLLPFVIGVFVLAVAAWAVGRYADGASVPLLTAASRSPRALPRWLPIVATVVTAALGVATVYQLYRIGDSGAKAAWNYVNQLPSR